MKRNTCVIVFVIGLVVVTGAVSWRIGRPSRSDAVWVIHDKSARQFLSDIERGEHAHLSEDWPNWSADEKHVISIARAQVDRVPCELLRYRIEQTETGYYVHVMWVQRNEDGYLYVPSAGAGHFGVSIFDDWKDIELHPGA